MAMSVANALLQIQYHFPFLQPSTDPDNKAWTARTPGRWVLEGYHVGMQVQIICEHPFFTADEDPRRAIALERNFAHPPSWTMLIILPKNSDQHLTPIFNNGMFSDATSIMNHLQQWCASFTTADENYDPDAMHTIDTDSAADAAADGDMDVDVDVDADIPVDDMS